MKTNKLTKILAMLFALLAVLITGCSTPSSDGGSDDDSTYKVEIGAVSCDDWMAYQNWRSSGPILSYNVLKQKRDTLYSQTIDGTYENKGRLSAADVKAYLMQYNYSETAANDCIEFADRCGNELALLELNSSTQEITWIYIEK